MSRKEKIEFIKKNHPDLYSQLRNVVPNIFVNPDCVSEKDIHIYNQFIVWYSGHVWDKSILQNLSF